MYKITLPGVPDKRAADYDLGDGKYARVIYTPQESSSDRKVIEVQAFEVDGFGLFVATPNGHPSRTPGTKHTIQTSGLGDTSTLLEGWVRVVGDYSATPEGNQKPLPTDIVIADALPSVPETEFAYILGTLYRWDKGVLETIMQGKAEELQRLLRASNSLADFNL